VWRRKRTTTTTTTAPAVTTTTTTTAPVPTTTSTSVAPSTGTRGSYMGISAGPFATTEVLDGIAALGLKWVRVSHEMGWNSGPGSLGALAATVQAANARGLRVLQCVQKSGHAYTANDIPALADFAIRCAQTGAALQLGNEWNNYPAFFNDPSYPPALAATISAQVGTAVRSMFPDTVVVTTGLSPAPAPLYSSSYWPAWWDVIPAQHAAAGYSIACAVHPYCYPEDPASMMTRPEWNPWAGIPALRDAMRARGINPTIWFTEVGCPGFATNAPVVRGVALTESLQAQNTATYLRQWWTERQSTEPLFIATLFDGQSATTSVEQGLGLIRTDGTRKPAWFNVRDFAAISI
jgi:hypothetical protein